MYTYISLRIYMCSNPERGGLRKGAAGGSPDIISAGRVHRAVDARLVEYPHLESLPVCFARRSHTRTSAASVCAAMYVTPGVLVYTYHRRKKK